MREREREKEGERKTIYGLSMLRPNTTKKIVFYDTASTMILELSNVFMYLYPFYFD